MQVTVNKRNARDEMSKVWQKLADMVNSDKSVVVSMRQETRTHEQNKKMWPMLTDISKHVKWFGKEYKPEDWKDLFTAALRQQDIVPGLEGGIVAFGHKTSLMDKQDFSDLIEYMYAFGSERNVQWSEPALKIYEQYR